MSIYISLISRQRFQWTKRQKLSYLAIPHLVVFSPRLYVARTGFCFQEPHALELPKRTGISQFTKPEKDDHGGNACNINIFVFFNPTQINEDLAFGLKARNLDVTETNLLIS
jgi:hypothetical protein